MIKEIMAYLNEYSYGKVGANPARKKLLTGKVEIYHVDQWLKCTPKAAKTFMTEKAPAPAVAPAPAISSPKAEGKKSKGLIPERRIVSAAAIEQQTADPNAAPPAIDMAAVRRRSEEMQRQAMADLRGQQSQPPAEGSEDEDEEARIDIPGDPELFAQRVEAIINQLSEIQFSSASGHRQLQQLTVELGEALDEFRGVIPEPEPEQ